MKDIRLIVFLFLILIFTLINSFAQNLRDHNIKALENFSYEKVLTSYLQRYIAMDDGSSCVPIRVSSDTYTGLTFPSVEDMFNYYQMEIKGGKEFPKIKKFVKWAKKIILTKDTIRLGKNLPYEEGRIWQFCELSMADSLSEYPDSKKNEIIKEIFNKKGIMYEKYWPDHKGKLFLKLFEWGFFLEIGVGWGPITYNIYIP